MKITEKRLREVYDAIKSTGKFRKLTFHKKDIAFNKQIANMCLKGINIKKSNLGTTKVFLKFEGGTLKLSSNYLSPITSTIGCCGTYRFNGFGKAMLREKYLFNLIKFSHDWINRLVY